MKAAAATTTENPHYTQLHGMHLIPLCFKLTSLTLRVFLPLLRLDLFQLHTTFCPTPLVYILLDLDLKAGNPVLKGLK